MTEHTETPPRVLFVAGGMTIANSTATGQTLDCLYLGYPSDRITQFARRHPSDPEIGRIVHMNRWTSPGGYGWHIAKVIVRRLGERLRLSGRDQSPGIVHNAIRPGTMTLRKRVSVGIDAIADLLPPFVSPRRIRELRAIAPEVIHTVVYNAFSVRLAILLSKRLRIPLLPQFTDDWITTIFTNGELGGRAKPSMDRLLRRLLDRSPALLVVGEAMAQEYERRYGHPCYIGAYGVEPSDYDVTPLPHAGKRLLYIGGGYIGRAEQIDRVARWAEPIGWEIVVHTTERNRWSPKSGNVRMAEELSLDALPQALIDADALLFVESLQLEVAEYTKYSVSTKVPQLIAARRPILAVGPQGQGSIEELRAGARDVCVLNAVDDAASASASAFLAADRGRADGEVPVKFRAETMQQNLVAALRYTVFSGGERPA